MINLTTFSKFVAKPLVNKIGNVCGRPVEELPPPFACKTFKNILYGIVELS